jgi:P-type Cu2+ transporter
MLPLVQDASSFFDSEPALQQGRFVVHGITCAACVLEIEALLQGLPGVNRVQVDPATESVRLHWDSRRVSPAAMSQKLQPAGYRLLPSADPALQEAEQREERKALWRLAVALLCMMQVMMYSTPIYLSAPGELDAQSESLLRWANWVLSLPVVFFSAGPFFSHAWTALRQGQITMDLAVVLGIVVALLAGTVASFDTQNILRAEIYLDSLVMFISFILVGRYFERVLRRRALARVDALLSDTPQSVVRQIGEHREEVISVGDLRPGDVIRLKAGSPVPADARVLDHAVQIEESMLTGESMPVVRRPGELVLAGSVNLQALARLQVTVTGERTQFAAMRRMIEAAAQTRPAYAQTIDRLAPIFLAFVLGAAALAALMWWSTDPARAIQSAIAVLIVTCPCALYLASPVALLRAAGVLATRGVMVQRLQALEGLAKVRSVIFDKTGTLTQHALEVTDLRCAGASPVGESLAAAAALAQHSTHPMARALVEYAKTSRIEIAQIDLASVTETPGKGMQGRILSGPVAGQTVRLGSSAFCNLPPCAPHEWSLHLSVVGDKATESRWLLSFALAEKLRPEARPMVSQFQREGLALALLSGDHPQATHRIGNQLGINNIHATQTPHDKLAHVRALQGEGSTVMMVGDGINDAASLAQADVSVVLGNASALAQSRADFIIQSEQLGDLIWLREVALKTHQVLRSNIAWALAYNAIAVPAAMSGWLAPWAAGLGMALSSILVVANSLRIGARR